MAAPVARDGHSWPGFNQLQPEVLPQLRHL